jgi:hypothetical protein
MDGARPTLKVGREILDRTNTNSTVDKKYTKIIGFSVKELFIRTRPYSPRVSYAQCVPAPNGHGHPALANGFFAPNGTGSHKVIASNCRVADNEHSRARPHP